MCELVAGVSFIIYFLLLVSDVVITVKTFVNFCLFVGIILERSFDKKDFLPIK